ncbi:hypothetical protein SUGI_1074640 [Cryptomeria japonica]|nr:hypothetical protein SUGI_1074640 [Cryptomeria japonica]
MQAVKGEKTMKTPIAVAAPKGPRSGHNRNREIAAQWSAQTHKPTKRSSRTILEMATTTREQRMGPKEEQTEEKPLPQTLPYTQKTTPTEGKPAHWPRQETRAKEEPPPTILISTWVVLVTINVVSCKNPNTASSSPSASSTPTALHLESLPHKMLLYGAEPMFVMVLDSNIVY